MTYALGVMLECRIYLLSRHMIHPADADGWEEVCAATIVGEITGETRCGGGCRRGGLDLRLGWEKTLDFNIIPVVTQIPVLLPMSY